MTEDRSLDLAGVGKLAEAIPDDSWNQIVNTVCYTFKELLAPITSTTGGIGRLINAKFDRFVDAEKWLAAQILKSAAEKASNSRYDSTRMPRASIMLKVIESSSTETDETLQELWSNLLANELADSSIHPEFIHILSRLSSTDAYRLIDLAQRSDPPKKVTLSFKVFGFEIKFKDIIEEPTDFTNVHLSNLGLIERPMVETENRSGEREKKPASYWKLTIVGEAFIKTVSNPSIKDANVD